MSDKPDKTQSAKWWQTLPGIMTAFGAIITASTGLLIALSQAGLIGQQAQPTPQPRKEKPSISAPTESVLAPPTVTTRAASLPTATLPDVASGEPASNLPTARPAPTHMALPTSGTGQYPIVLAAGDQAPAGEAVYTIIAAQIEKRTADQLAMRFVIRMTNTSPYATAFTDRSARLIVDGLPIATEDNPDVLVDGQSAQEAEFLFLLPDNPTTVELQVGEVGHETARIPIDLKSAQP